MNIDAAKLPKPSRPESLEIWNEKIKKISNGIERAFADSIFTNSPYLSSLITKNFDFFEDIFNTGFEKNFEKIIKEIEELNSEDTDEIYRTLRKAKQKAALLIAMAEISEYWNISETTDKLSIFADICIKKSAEFIFLKQHKLGTIKLNDLKNPLDECGLTIIALGKLGSNELNYSSDIDLAFFFDEEKLQYNGKKTLQIFYIDLVKELIDFLSKITKDGYVFRVDVRLRPDPASNPVAISLTKAERYYFTVGQNWERAAMIKARFVCGDEETTEIFFGFNNKNVWRRSLDFETIEDIHSIKRQIDTKTGIHKDSLYGYDIKLGRGGIREIEFFCQTQQLIWGGRKVSLRVRKTLESLENLYDESEISKVARKDLSDAYIFYRLVEHRLQMINDEQTHSLPSNSEKMQELAIFCGFENEKSFIEELHKHIEKVSDHYGKLFESSPSLAISNEEFGGSLIFTGIENHPETLRTLKKLGFSDPEKISEIVRGWHHGRYECTKKNRSRAVLTKLMPLLIKSFAEAPYPDAAFTRFDEFLGRVPAGTQIFSMLYMNPSIMDLLAEIMGGYQQLALSLTKNPTLLDYVLAPEFYDSLPDMEYLKNNLEELISANSDDIEGIFESIKDWANDRKFRVGIQFLRGEIDSDEVFLNLSNIAETVIKTLQVHIEKDFVEDFGEIEGGKFSCIALGKLGSRELTFNSDLDLVFVYDFPQYIFSADKSDVNPSSYYLRMANKIVYALSSISRTGKLYEVDLRLRPLGESGPIATSLRSFDEYYNPGRSEGAAWVWEYMALTRARVIGASEEFNKEIEHLIKEKLYYNWEEETLNSGAKYIYKKFRQSSKPNGEMDIKKSVGGIFDLEFMIRFMQLKNLNKYPDIYSIRTEETIKSLKKFKILNKEDSDNIFAAYEFFKDIQNILRITSEIKINNYTKKLLCEFLNLKNYAELQKKLEFHKSRVKNIFDKHLKFNV